MKKKHQTRCRHKIYPFIKQGDMGRAQYLLDKIKTQTRRFSLPLVVVSSYPVGSGISSVRVSTATSALPLAQALVG